MHLGMTGCHIPFLGHCDLDLCPSSKNYCVRSTTLIFFELGIPYLVCGCILEQRSVMYHVRVTVTLTSDLVFRVIMSKAYLLFYLR